MAWQIIYHPADADSVDKALASLGTEDMERQPNKDVPRGQMYVVDPDHLIRWAV